MARPIAAFDGVAACTVVAAVARVSVAVAPIFSHELIGAVRDSDIIGGGGLTDLFHVPTELKEQDVDCGGYHHGDTHDKLSVRLVQRVSFNGTEQASTRPRRAEVHPYHCRDWPFVHVQ